MYSVMPPRQVPFAVSVDGDRHVGADLLAHSMQASEIDHRVAMPDFDLDEPEALLNHSTLCAGTELLQRDRQPADVGVVGLDPCACGPAKKAPERQVRVLSSQVPERDVDCSQRKLRNASPPDPLQGGAAGELVR
jgi:hypothetical protein